MDYQNYDLQIKKQLASYLSEYVTENKLTLINRVLPNRTRFLTIVLEDIYQPHNASAVIRSCEAFGVQDIHIIEQNNSYRINPDITLGSNKWVNIYNYKRVGINNTDYCLKHLKNKGYKIAATTLRPGSMDLKDLPVDDKIALCFGNEETGLTEEAHQLSDYFVKIPMIGFTQSLNLSVSAALCLYDVMNRLKSEQNDWKCDDEEQLNLKIEWLLKNLKNSHNYLENFEKSL